MDRTYTTYVEEKLLKKIAKKKKQIENLTGELIEHYQLFTFTCSSCCQHSNFFNLVFVQVYNGSGDLKVLENQVMCPACGLRHRLMSKDSHEKYIIFPEDIMPEDIYNRVIEKHGSSFLAVINPPFGSEYRVPVTYHNKVKLSSTNEIEI